jgi:hypothetical protein
MENIVFGLGCLSIGLIFVIFNKFVTEVSIIIQECFGFHFDDGDRKITRIIYMLGGIFFIGVGTLVLLTALSFI